MIDETDIREQLAAFLAGDLDEPAAGALQARIDAEPWVGRLADEMADLLVTLGRVDAVEPRAGFAERMRAGLVEEIGRPLAALPPVAAPDQRALAASGAAAATGWADAGPAGRRDVNRPRVGSGRPARRNRLRGMLGVAAVIAVLAVAGVGVLTRTGPEDRSDSAEFAAGDTDTAEVAEDDSAAASSTGEDRAQDDGAADDAAFATDGSGEAANQAEPMDAAVGEEGREDEPTEAAAAEAAPAPEAPASADNATADNAAADQLGASESGPEQLTATTAPSRDDGPAVVVVGALDGTDQAIAAALADQPAAEALLGGAAADAVELAAAYRDELLRGGDFPDGTPAASCLTDTLGAAGDDLVPAVAARIDLPDGPTVAYALVRSSAGEVLDTIDVWVLDLPGCGVDRVVQTG